MNAPEFNQPKRDHKALKVGDMVSFRDDNLEERIGRITDHWPGDKFGIDSNEEPYFRQGSEIFPVELHSLPGNESTSAPTSPPATASDVLGSTRGISSHTPQSIAKHLTAGGEAFYVPNTKRYGPDSGKLDLQDGSNERERIPLHSIWFGDENNLTEIIDFGDVADGSASIDLGPASPPKQKAPPPAHPLDRLSDTEVSTFIRSGASKAFDGVPAEDRAQKHGGHSIDSLLGDPKSATRGNVSAFVSAMRQFREKSNQETSQVVQDVSSPQRATETASPREMAAIQVQAAREDSRKERAESDPEQADSGHGIDAVQTALDGIGLAGDAVLPGSGVAADGTNAVISLARAATDPKNAGKHLKNAAISTVSMVPFVGDLAKVFRYGPQAAKAAGKGAARGGNVADDAAVSERVRRFLAGEDDELPEQTQTGGGGNSPPDSPGSAASDSGNSGNGDDGDPLTERSAGIKYKVFEFGSVVGKASAATVAAANSVSLLNKAAIEYHRDLVKYNGEIAGAYGKLETDRTMRSIKSAGEQSGSLSGLVESQSRLEDTLQDFQSPWQVIGADALKILTEIVNLLVWIVDMIEPISEIYVNYIRPWFVKAGVLTNIIPNKLDGGALFDQLKADAARKMKNGRKI